ncbi:MAG: Gmad2 immunoglobulin-like domain-containing protein [Anaerolineales bacterium]|nr:Gmad2 immunoglobulin-like domain-containing protein [Anaerolineales bacterium]
MTIRPAGAALLGALLLPLFACQLPTAAPTATAEPPTSARPTASSTPPPTTASPAATGTATTRPGPQEAIFLRVPGPGSRAVSPLPVEGSAAPTFEQNLVMRLLSFDGRVLAQGPLTIEAPLGERGPFTGELTFEVSEQQPAALQVFSTSARDGGITHLDAEIVTLLPGGEAEITAAEPAPERIQIRAPEAGQVVEGGQVTVRGFGWASFEATLVIEVHDADGAVVGRAPVTVEAPDLGEPGPFEAQVSYSVTATGPGRIVVLDPSPAFGGPVHLNSVNVELHP